MSVNQIENSLGGIKLPLIDNFIEPSDTPLSDTEVALNVLHIGGITKFKGILPYNQLRKLIKGYGLNAHHLIEQRFNKLFVGLNTDIAKLSIALTKEEHQIFTNKWRKLISYGEGTADAMYDGVMDTASKIYEEYPEILRALGLRK